ncbi:3-hydroxybutyryl-CoA dehydratase [Diplonema papillatum]|nr:3-hydroxybutyryl-CoA dehydratase [Diplonema papillatum]
MFRRSLCLRRPLAVGDRATGPERVFGKADLEAFLAVAGDTNTVHRTGDETVEGGAVLLPGMMVASLISGVMGSQLPGPGSLYLSQKLNFRRPAQVGEALRAEVNVTALSPSRCCIRMETKVLDSADRVVVDGEALGMNKTPRLWK